MAIAIKSKKSESGYKPVAINKYVPLSTTYMGGVFAKYSVQAVAWLFSKKSGLFFGISRFKKIDTVS